MAGIDKMHMTREETYKFYEWFYNHYKINEVGKEMFENVTFRPDEPKNIYATFNFSCETDRYLMKNCKLKHVQKRLKEQYG